MSPEAPLRRQTFVVLCQREGVPAKFIKVCQREHFVGLSYRKSDILKKHSFTDHPNELLYGRDVNGDMMASIMKAEVK